MTIESEYTPEPPIPWKALHMILKNTISTHTTALMVGF
jgi:hypothetical protein